MDTLATVSWWRWLIVLVGGIVSAAIGWTALVLISLWGPWNTRDIDGPFRTADRVAVALIAAVLLLVAVGFGAVTWRSARRWRQGGAVEGRAAAGTAS